MKKLTYLICLLSSIFCYAQCTTYGSASAVEFSGTCNETANRNHNGSGVLTISGDLSWSSGTFFVRGPVVVTGNLTFTGTGNLRILVDGSVSVADGGTLTALGVQVGANGSLTIDNGGTMTSTSFENDFSGPATNTVTINGSLTVSPGSFTNNGNGVIAGSGTLDSDVTDNGTSTFSGTHIGSCTGGCPGVLPVEFISFDGQQMNSDYKLYWSTASEINNDGFFIQKRISGQEDWYEIGFVSGNGNSSEMLQYSFVDRAASREAYYRLKQIDYDGKFDYSEVIRYQPFIIEDPVVVYPSKFNGTVSFINWPAEVNKVELINSNGQLLMSSSLLKNESEDQLASLLSSSPKGFYFINVHTSTKIHQMRIIN